MTSIYHKHSRGIIKVISRKLLNLKLLIAASDKVIRKIESQIAFNKQIFESVNQSIREWQVRESKLTRTNAKELHESSSWSEKGYALKREAQQRCNKLSEKLHIEISKAAPLKRQWQELDEQVKKLKLNLKKDNFIKSLVADEEIGS